MDADGTAAQFHAVQHQVVGPRQALMQVGLLCCLLRRGKGMVQGIPAPFRFVILEQRKIHHPQRRPVALQQVQVLAQFHAQGR